MCLGIPGRVIRRLDGYGGQLALVDVAGEQRKVNVGMLDDPDLGPGDWIVIHMGFAMERVDEAGAERAMAGLELLGRHPDDSRHRPGDDSGHRPGVASGHRPGDEPGARP